MDSVMKNFCARTAPVRLTKDRAVGRLTGCLFIVHILLFPVRHARYACTCNVPVEGPFTLLFI